MNSGILDAITHGLGVAVSPLVMIVLVLILLSPRAFSNGPAFLAGWVIGLAALGAIVFALGGFGEHGRAHVYEGPIKLAFGVLLLGFAYRVWRRSRQPRDGGGSSWMSTADTFGVAKSAAAGLFFAAIYPKNLILTVAAASELSKSSTTGQEIGGYVLFMVLGSLTIAGLVLLCLFLGEKVDPLLGRLNAWLSAHDQTILAALLLVFGLKLSITGVVHMAGA